MADLIDFTQLDETERKMFHAYGKVNEARKSFIKKATPSTFKFLFGDNEGSRLWSHFVIDCKRNYDKFETYLVRDQYNTLLVNITLNEHLYLE